MSNERFIYFMQIGENGPIKIGLTFKVQRRLAQAQTFNYQPITLLSSFPGSQTLETVLLKRFSRHRLRGEWFEFNDELFNLTKGVFNVEYESSGDKNWLVLYRQSDNRMTDPCPFCLVPHSHGIGDGHRVAHCLPQYGFSSIKTLDGTTLHRDDGYIIKTRNPDGPGPEEVRYNRASITRFKIIRNLLTFATNKFIETGVFSLDPSTTPPKDGVEQLVDYPDGTPCKIRCYNAGFDEVGLEILFGIKKPNPPIYSYISRQSKELCSAHASGWLERRTGAYLQIPDSSTSLELFCEKHICQQLAEIEIQPIANSFEKQGPFHL